LKLWNRVHDSPRSERARSCCGRSCLDSPSEAVAVRALGTASNAPVARGARSSRLVWQSQTALVHHSACLGEVPIKLALQP
jgi:hypothetical protein